MNTEIEVIIHLTIFPSSAMLQNQISPINEQIIQINFVKWINRLYEKIWLRNIINLQIKPYYFFFKNPFLAFSLFLTQSFCLAL